MGRFFSPNSIARAVDAWSTLSYSICNGSFNVRNLPTRSLFIVFFMIQERSDPYLMAHLMPLLVAHLMPLLVAHLMSLLMAHLIPLLIAHLKPLMAHLVPLLVAKPHGILDLHTWNKFLEFHLKKKYLDCVNVTFEEKNVEKSVESIVDIE